MKRQVLDKAGLMQAGGSKTSVNMSSTNMIDRNYLILNGMLNLGLEVRYVEAFDFERPDPQLMTDAIHLVQ